MALYGRTPEQDLTDRATKIIEECQLTSFESYLAKSLLKKGKEERVSALQKYFGLYATVKASSIEPTLYKEAKKLMEKA